MSGRIGAGGASSSGVSNFSGVEVAVILSQTLYVLSEVRMASEKALGDKVRAQRAQLLARCCARLLVFLSSHCLDAKRPSFVGLFARWVVRHLSMVCKHTKADVASSNIEVHHQHQRTPLLDSPNTPRRFVEALVCTTTVHTPAVWVGMSDKSNHTKKVEATQ